MKIPLKLFMLIIIIVCIIVVAVAAATAGPRTTVNTPKGVKTFTVQAAPGISAVTINNLNTAGGAITIPALECPYSFNYTAGNRLTFSATTEEGYSFNGWVFTRGNTADLHLAGTWDKHNPLTLMPIDNVVMTATILIGEQP
jgi:hypothetical protein